MVSSLLRITTSYLGLFSYLVYEIALRAFYNILILVLFLLKHWWTGNQKLNPQQVCGTYFYLQAHFT